MNEHPSAAELERFWAGQLDGPQRRAVVRHLLQGCVDCREKGWQELGGLSILWAGVAGDARQGPQPDTDEAAYESVVSRALAAARAMRRRAEREEARKVEVLELVRSQGPARVLELPRRLQGIPAYLACLELSWEARQEEPQKMVALAFIAHVIAGKLDSKEHGSGRVACLRCRAKIELANAYRSANRLDEAEQALGEAREELAGASKLDPLVSARLFEIHGNILGDRRHFDQAFAAFERAERIYRRYQQPRLVSRLLVQKGLYAEYAGDPELGIKLLERSLALIAPDEDPELALAVIHNISRALLESDRCRAARALLWKHQSLYWRHAGRIDLLKLDWLQARLAERLGSPERAEAQFEKVRIGMEEVGKPFEAAVATLDLAALLIKRGKLDRAQELVLGAAEVFRGLKIGREALMAVRLLRETVALGTLEFVPRVAEFLRRLERNPRLTFRSYFRS